MPPAPNSDSALAHTVPIATVQAPPVFLNLEASTELAVSLIDRAAASGAWLTVFPETWLPGYPVWLDFAPGAGLWNHAPAKALFAHLVQQCPTLRSPQVEQIHQAAQRAGTHVVMGMQERDGATLYNTTVYLDADGVTRRIHRKLVPTWTERLLWGRGDGSTLQAMTTAQATVGALICWEHWMPLARAAMHAQREHVHVAQWPTVNELHQLASRHYAFEGQCFVIAAGTTLTRGQLLAGFDSAAAGGDDTPAARSLLASIPGDADTLLMAGGSAVIGPDGTWVAEPAAPEVELLLADLPLHRLAEGWMTLDTDGHYSRPDVFELRVNQQVQANVRFEAPPARDPPLPATAAQPTASPGRDRGDR